MKVSEYIKKILNFSKNRKYNEAYSLLSEALGIYPDNNFLKKYEIYLLFKIKKIEKAKEIGEKIFNEYLNDEFFNYYYLLVLENYDKELLKNYIEKILMLQPDFKPDFYKSLLKIILRNFPKNADYFLKKLPENIQKDNIKLKFQNMPVKKAIEEIENLMILPSYNNDFELNLLLASLYKKVKRYNDALKIYEKLLPVAKDETFIYKMIGYIYYNLKNYKKAKEYLNEVFIKNPDDVILIKTIYRIYEKEKDFEGFKNLIENVISKYPDYKKLYGYLKKAEKWKNT